ncbi:MAG TPA: proteasome accessory factor PafA2 family protein [Nitrospirales bacterium]|nr:proteasome accessory factor PafA2 family protein [Nitrospirales bacterium]
MNPIRLFGIETEYGIAREDCENADPVVESMELVRAYLDGHFTRRWDYRGEHPHEDQRGFRVTELAQDKEEELFAEQDAHRPFSFHDMKSDLVLPNGARFYNDHTHPEYSTPECRSLKDIVAHDRAGERILLVAAQRRNKAMGGSMIQLYKNNTDFHGHSYGCHDNYLVSRSLKFEELVRGLLPFLVSRQLIAGAGKVGREAQGRGFVPGGFQLSQRADFMEAELGVDTMHNRPILNTRDEPHANRERYRRLHLIVGDANMCEYATALKIGTTRVVLDMIAGGVLPPCELDSPVQAIQALSRDPELSTLVKRQAGGMISGVDIQREYLNAAWKFFPEMDEETTWILQEWEQVLDLLERDRGQLVGKIDWVTKRWLLEAFMQAENIGWDDPWLASLDLEYHNIDPERGLFFGLEGEGRTTRICQEPEIQEAMKHGPADTRGGLRGLCVQRFGKDITSIQWEGVDFSSHNGKFHLDLLDHLEPVSVSRCRSEIEHAETPFDLMESMASKNSSCGG